MTKIESIHKAKLLWQTMVDKRFTRKSEAYAFLGLEFDDAYCPFCQYILTLPERSCRSCPAIEEWTYKDNAPDVGSIIKSHCGHSKEYSLEWNSKGNPLPMLELVQRLLDKQ